MDIPHSSRYTPFCGYVGLHRQLQLPVPQRVLHHPETFSVPLESGVGRWGPLRIFFHWSRREALPKWKVKAIKSLGDAHKREGQRAAQSLRSKNKGKQRPWEDAALRCAPPGRLAGAVSRADSPALGAADEGVVRGTQSLTSAGPEARTRLHATQGPSHSCIPAPFWDLDARWMPGAVPGGARTGNLWGNRG